MSFSELYQEFSSLGVSCADTFYENSTPQSFFDNTNFQHLLRQFRELKSSNELLKEECHIFKRDAIHWENQFKKSRIEIAEKERALEIRDERERRLIFDLSEVKEDLKRKSREIKRLQQTNILRENQYKHERLRLEKEMISLKNTLSSNQMSIINRNYSPSLRRNNSLIDNKFGNKIISSTTSTSSTSSPTIVILNDLPTRITKPKKNLIENQSIINYSNDKKWEEQLNQMIIETRGLRLILVSFIQRLKNLIQYKDDQHIQTDDETHLLHEGIPIDKLILMPFHLVEVDIKTEVDRVLHETKKCIYQRPMNKLGDMEFPREYKNCQIENQNVHLDEIHRLQELVSQYEIIMEKQENLLNLKSKKKIRNVNQIQQQQQQYQIHHQEATNEEEENRIATCDDNDISIPRPFPSSSLSWMLKAPEKEEIVFDYEEFNSDSQSSAEQDNLGPLPLSNVAIGYSTPKKTPDENNPFGFHSVRDCRPDGESSVEN